MRYTLTLLVLTFFYAASAQVIKFSLEDSTKQARNYTTWTTKSKSSFQDGNNIIQVESSGVNMLQLGYTATYNSEKQALKINKFDAGGNEIAVNKLENGEREFGPIPTVSIEFSKRILLFYFKYVDKDSMKLFVSEVDRGDLSLKNTQHLFSFRQENVGLFKLARALRRSIVVKVSPDKSKLLVTVPGQKDELFTCILGKDMNIIREKISPVKTKGDIEIADIVLENSGNDIIVYGESISPANSQETVMAKLLLIQKADNTEQLFEFNTIDGDHKPYDIHFAVAKSNLKIYMFGNYEGVAVKAGIWFTEIETDKLNINTPVSIPYPDDFKKRVHKLGFGDKRKGEYGILGVDYELVEFENGDIALCGNPVSRDDRTSNFGNTHSGYVMYFGGPVFVCFINNDKKGNVFTMIPRNQNYCSGSKGVYIPYHDKLIVFYNDYAKNLREDILSDDVHQQSGAIVRELSLAYAIIKKDGTIESRKLMEEGLSRLNYYNTGDCNIISDKKLLIPSASVEKKTDIIKVATITIE